MTQRKPYPQRGHVYSLRDILTALELQDSPSLQYRNNPIQTAHLTSEQLLSVPGMAETRWQYLRTTIEWIPIFVHADGDVPVDVEPNVDHPKLLWITPKGFPREQYRSESC